MSITSTARICGKYNPRVWIVLAAALTMSAADQQTRIIPLPAGKSLAIEVTVGNVRIEGTGKGDAEISIERHAPSTAQLEKLPIAIDDTPSRVSVRVIQADGATDPALRSDITIRVPHAAVIDRVHVLEGRITVSRFAGALTADIRRGSIEGKDLSGTLRLESGIGSVVLTGARLSPNGLLRLRAFNGDVRLALAERPVDARIMALALNGSITSQIPLTMKDTWGPRWGETTLGKGEPVISLDVITGTIEIKSP
jgi:DUF4097 and DUF4098 domain-containing protein YvlB